MPRKPAEDKTGETVASPSSVRKVRVFPAKDAHLVVFHYAPVDGGPVSDGFASREEAVRAATAEYPGAELRFDR